MKSISESLYEALTRGADKPENPRFAAHKEYTRLAAKLSAVAFCAADLPDDADVGKFKDLSLEVLNAAVGMVQMAGVINEVEKIERENA